MTPSPHCVQLDDSLLVARTMMVEHDVRHLPVKDGHQLVGILTDRDLRRALDSDLGMPPKDQLLVREPSFRRIWRRPPGVCSLLRCRGKVSQSMGRIPQTRVVPKRPWSLKSAKHPEMATEPPGARALLKAWTSS